jgi:hypothetical protein
MPGYQRQNREIGKPNAGAVNRVTVAAAFTTSLPCRPTLLGLLAFAVMVPLAADKSLLMARRVCPLLGVKQNISLSRSGSVNDREFDSKKTGTSS